MKNMTCCRSHSLGYDISSIIVISFNKNAKKKLNIRENVYVCMCICLSFSELYCIPNLFPLKLKIQNSVSVKKNTKQQNLMLHI